MLLFHSPMSFNARRAVMTTIELALDIELVHVDLAKGAQKQPEFLKMNVAGRVPVLEDDGFYLAESNAIMQYLADETAGQTLYPRDPRRRADVNRWLFWSAHHLSPSVGILNWERGVKAFLGLGDPDPALVARGEVLFGESIRALDRHLEGREFVSGEALSLADLAIATPFMTMARAKLPMGESPHALAWLDRMRQRDSWKKTDL